MAKSRVTRRALLLGAAPAVATIPLVRLALPGSAGAVPAAMHEGHDERALGHAAMIGDAAPAPGGPNDLDSLLRPEPARPASPGRVREYELVAVDKDIEVAQGVTFSAWTYNGTVPGPIIRVDRGRPPARALRERRLASAHDPLPRHPPGEHGRRVRDRRPGRDVHLRVSRRRPAGFHLYHCHCDAAQEAHPQGPLRRADHRPARASATGAGARHGDERLRHRRRR